MKLTPKTYHSDKNTYLTNSKISLFLKSKEAYKARYIDKTESPEKTSSMILGCAVDLAFEKGKSSAINKVFKLEFKRTCTKKDNPGLYEQESELLRLNELDPREGLNQSEYMKVKEMAKKILKSDLYKRLDSYRFKKGMGIPDKIIHFQKVLTDEQLQYAGMLDAMVVDDKNKIVEIWDLKTSAVMAMKSKNSYFYHCLEFRYFSQLAGYKHLVALKYPGYEIKCYHLTIGSSDYFPVKLFTFDNELIDREWPFIKLMIQAIKDEREWKDPFPTMNDTILITQPEKK